MCVLHDKFPETINNILGSRSLPCLTFHYSTESHSHLSKEDTIFFTHFEIYIDFFNVDIWGEHLCTVGRVNYLPGFLTEFSQKIFPYFIVLRELLMLWCVF